MDVLGGGGGCALLGEEAESEYGCTGKPMTFGERLHKLELQRKLDVMGASPTTLSRIDHQHRTTLYA